MATITPIATSEQVKSEKALTTMNPDAYIVTNYNQRRYNLRALDLLQDSFVAESKEQQFLDLGCGTGDFTRDHLLPRCSPLERMVAVDVSQDMVEFAKKHFAHPKISYDVLDISGNGVTDFVKRYGQFDRLYSFHCLNWVRDQETSFRNIAELLKPGGGCLLHFPASGCGIDLRKELATMDHWQKYRKVLESTLPTSADLVDRDALVSYISGLLKNSSLIPTTCEVLHLTHSYSSVQEMIRIYMGLSCLGTLVTEEDQPLLLKDLSEYAAKEWAEHEASGSPFGGHFFLVRAHKPRF